jgi:hypothetical protein
MYSRTTMSSDQSRWASGLNVLVGLWLLISPFVLGFSAPTNVPFRPSAMWNDIILGIVIAIIAAIRFFGAYQATWLSWLNVILGIWVIVSPWVLGFSSTPTPMWDNVIVGIVVVILGIWAAVTSPRPTTMTQTGVR